MIHYVSETGNVRMTSDEYNQRLLLVEYKCFKCGEWVAEDDVVWVPGWAEGNPYCVDCAPEV